MCTKDIFWLAGLLEGEGCFADCPGGMPRSPRIQIRLAMTDNDVVARASKIMGGSIYVNKKRTKGGKLVFHCSVWNARARGWMMTLYPLLGERRRQRIKQILGSWRSRPMQLASVSRTWRRVGKPLTLVNLCHPDQPYGGHRGLCASCYSRGSRRRRGDIRVVQTQRFGKCYDCKALASLGRHRCEKHLEAGRISSKAYSHRLMLPVVGP